MTNIVIIGKSTRILCPQLLKVAKVISSHELLSCVDGSHELIASASTVIFAAYRKELDGSINFTASLDAARLVAQLISDPSRLLFLSSDHVFSGAGGSYSVYDALDPISVYGKVKAAQEEIFHKSVIIRFTVLGPSFSARPLITEIAASGKNIIAYPNQYFSPVSTWSINYMLQKHVQCQLKPGVHHLASNRASKASIFEKLLTIYGVPLSMTKDFGQISDHSLIPSENLECSITNEIDLATNQISPILHFL
jgi:dTDP-4-dehydrorhamnose reductase